MNGAILSTTDGGATWNSNASGSTLWLYSVFFSNSTNGFAVGAYGLIVASTNGGVNWTTQTSNTTYTLNGVYFTDAMHGCAIGDFGTILKTVDGGINWTTVHTNDAYAFQAVQFIDASIGYAAGDFGTILKTTDGGDNWTQQNGATDYIHAMFFKDADHGYCVGDNGSYFTTADGGANWTETTIDSDYLMEGIFFATDDTGYICGYDWGTSSGLILKTIDGGITSCKKKNNESLPYRMRLTKQASNINILRNIAWPNEVEQEFFKNDAQKLPKVDYKPFDPKPVLDELKKARNLFGANDIIDNWAGRIANKLESSALLLSARGTQDFFTHSKNMYGCPKDILPDGQSTALDLAQYFGELLTTSKILI
jgi:photosystem II stability/assembly factor-like uncharacterized protein